MAEITNQTAPNTSEAEGNNAAQDGKENGAPVAESGEIKAFTQADVDRIVQQRLDDEKRRHEKRREEDRKAAEAERIRLSGDKDAYIKQLEEQVREFEAREKQREVAELRQSIAAKKNLAPKLLKFVSGETEAEITESVKEIASLFPVTPPPDPEAGNRLRAGEAQRKIRDDEREAMMATGNYSAF